MCKTIDLESSCTDSDKGYAIDDTCSFRVLPILITLSAYMSHFVFQTDGKRRDTVFINGIHHSLDLVALICYWKLKQKYPGWFTIFHSEVQNCIAAYNVRTWLLNIHCYSVTTVR